MKSDGNAIADNVGFPSGRDSIIAIVGGNLIFISGENLDRTTRTGCLKSKLQGLSGGDTSVEFRIADNVDTALLGVDFCVPDAVDLTVDLDRDLPSTHSSLWCVGPVGDIPGIPGATDFITEISSVCCSLGRIGCATIERRRNERNLPGSIGRRIFTRSSETIKAILIFLFETEDEVCFRQLVKRDSANQGFFSPGVVRLRRGTDHHAIRAVSDGKLSIGKILKIQFVRGWIKSIDHVH